MIDEVKYTNPAELDSAQYPLEGYTYRGDTCCFTVSNTFLVFLSFMKDSQE